MQKKGWGTHFIFNSNCNHPFDPQQIKFGYLHQQCFTFRFIDQPGKCNTAAVKKESNNRFIDFIQIKLRWSQLTTLQPIFAWR